MAEDVDKAEADVPADAAAEDLESAELTEVDEAELTASERVAMAAVAARPVRKQSAEGASGKGAATPKQRRRNPEDYERRATPAEFVRESVAELKKVVWPTPSQLQQYFIVVLVFVLIMMVIVALLDVVFGAGMLKIFG
ncbi:preprotein translocase subunit SecE [Propionicimonas paludicola]|uniref:Protein translocase subunit SecE n=1 Tax=Propionicimonas paludicola TaxID=185243 RepID=A0A2A9CSI7_9ACTN|nr:preprotein translocase subunit SecE [Propionicimonas paludicola]PFG17035.1 preprotein translocase subunit SecE [Propionicimonas paludicola]